MTFDFVHTLVILDYGGELVIKAGKPLKTEGHVDQPMPDCCHMMLNWHLFEHWRVLPSKQNNITLWAYLTTTKSETTVDIIADEVDQASCRGILEIFAQGRPTVGLIPLVFLNAG